MIGDNPKSDIRGGNNNGCVSILVRYAIQYFSAVFFDNTVLDYAAFDLEILTTQEWCI